MSIEDYDKELADHRFGDRLADIISYISSINDEISIIEEMPSVHTQYLPQEFFDFKHKFFEFLSGITLFHLNLKNNPDLKNQIIDNFDNDLDRINDQIYELEWTKAATERHKNFFVNFCKFSSELKCGTTSQSSKASKQSKNV